MKYRRRHHEIPADQGERGGVAQFHVCRIAAISLRRAGLSFFARRRPSSDIARFMRSDAIAADAIGLLKPTASLSSADFPQVLAPSRYAPPHG
jgi:hypothetical protein